MVCCIPLLSVSVRMEPSEGVGGGGGGVGPNAKKQQTVRGSSRQRPAREVKSGEAGRGWKIDAKSGVANQSPAEED